MSKKRFQPGITATEEDEARTAAVKQKMAEAGVKLTALMIYRAGLAYYEGVRPDDIIEM